MNINLQTWFATRELDFCPKHFVKANTKLTKESKLWVLEKLSGRFFISASELTMFLDFEGIIYFEDPQEAVFYEIAWS
jgi:hypothetical protein